MGTALFKASLSMQIHFNYLETWFHDRIQAQNDPYLPSKQKKQKKKKI